MMGFTYKGVATIALAVLSVLVILTSPLLAGSRIISTIGGLQITTPSVEPDAFLTRGLYKDLAEYIAPEYFQNDPFPHIYFDNLLPPSLVAECSNEIPHVNVQNLEHKYFADPDQTGKLDLINEDEIGPSCMALLNHARSSNFIAFLEALSGIENLLYDPHMYGGGIHQSLTSGVLGVHTDFNVHPYHLQKGNHIWRRVNVFFYLNDDWKEEFNGHLELWSSDMKSKVKSYLPIANRVVIFSSSRISFHGHPEPLKCPPNRTRKSIANYYYTTYPGPTDSTSHGFINTVFKTRPLDVDGLGNDL